MTENPQAQFTEAQIREARTSEAQIAVHWREEEYIYPPESFIAQANAADPAIFDRFAEDQFPGLLHRVRRLAELGQEMGHRPGHQ